MIDRYTTFETDEGFYVYDSLDENIVPATTPFPSKMEAEIQATIMNQMGPVRLGIYKAIEEERASQDANFGSMMGASNGTHLAVLMKKVGDTATSLLLRAPVERNLEEEVRQVATVAIRWLEAIDGDR